MRNGGKTLALMCTRGGYGAVRWISADNKRFELFGLAIAVALDDFGLPQIGQPAEPIVERPAPRSEMKISTLRPSFGSGRR